MKNNKFKHLTTFLTTGLVCTAVITISSAPDMPASDVPAIGQEIVVQNSNAPENDGDHSDITPLHDNPPFDNQKK